MLSNTKAHVAALVLCLTALSLPATAAAADETVTFTVTHTATGYEATPSTGGSSIRGSLKQVVEGTVAALGSSGGAVVFGEGVFDFGAGYAELKDIRNIEFRGAGMGVTVLKNYSDRLRDTEPFNVVGAWDVVVRDMTVSAGGPDRFTSDALDFDKGNRVLIERVEVDDSRGRGIVFDGKGDGWTADDNVIRDCRVRNVPSDGIELLAADRNVVERCEIANVGGHGIQSVKASSNADQPHKTANDNTFAGNSVHESGEDGIQLSGGSRNAVIGNVVLNSGNLVTGRSGIRLMASDGIRTSETTVRGNRASDDQSTKTQTYGLDIAGPDVVGTLVDSNDFAGNKLAPLRDRGTGTSIVLPPDSTAPSVPTGVAADAVTSAQVNVTWAASTDDVGVTGYRVYRDGQALQDVAGTTLGFSDGTTAADTEYSYAVDAVDAAGNRSAPSVAAVVRTPGAGGTYTLNPSADAYVSSDNVTRNFGSTTTLRIDAEPVQRSYLRFDVPTMSSPVLSAKLRLYANGGSAVGHQVHVVSDSSWEERAITHSTAPALGEVVASSGAFSGGRYVDVDVTRLVASGSVLSVGTSGTSATGVAYASRETSTPPELVIVRGTDTTPPTVPTDLTATAASGAQVDLTWTGSTDDVGVAGYRVYRDGDALADLPPEARSYSDTAVVPATEYSYTLDAADEAGNRSPQTAAVSVVTRQVESTSTLIAEADTYVAADNSQRNYGTATTLRVDADPVIRSYVRFAVPMFSTPVTRATLRVYSNVNSTAGHRVHPVADSTWGERTMTDATAPAFGDVVGISGAIKSGAYSDVDVTALVQPGQPLSIVMTGTSSTAISYASRESANPPLLVIER